VPERSSPAAPGPLSQLRFWAAWWVVLGALWLLLDDTVALPELIAGAVAAAVGATAVSLVRAREVVVLRPRARWIRRGWRPVLQVLPDLRLLLLALWRRVVRRREVTGSFRAVPFRARADAGERAAGEALAIAAGSFGPNTYVIDVDGERELLLMHQLLPGKDVARSADPLELG